MIGDRSGLPAWERVLVVVAHPDDESFGLGAVVDAFVRSGARVRVLCLTRGEASSLGAGAGLAAVRAQELRTAAALLGAEQATLLGWPDGYLHVTDTVALAADVDREIAAFAPSGLLAFDSSGVTGHPDHVAATEAAVQAGRRAGLPVLGWTIPEGVARQLNDEYHADFRGHDPAHVDLDVRVDRRRQHQAVGAHGSQAVPGSVLWRRLELLGDHESLRWLEPGPASADPPTPMLASGELTTSQSEAP